MTDLKALFQNSLAVLRRRYKVLREEEEIEILATINPSKDGSFEVEKNGSIKISTSEKLHVLDVSDVVFYKDKKYRVEIEKSYENHYEYEAFLWEDVAVSDPGIYKINDNEDLFEVLKEGVLLELNQSGFNDAKVFRWGAKGWRGEDMVMITFNDYKDERLHPEQNADEYYFNFSVECDLSSFFDDGLVFLQDVHNSLQTNGELARFLEGKNVQWEIKELIAIKKDEPYNKHKKIARAQISLRLFCSRLRK